MPAQRLFLIDGYSNIFRAFYALRNLSNSKGEPTNAVYGFINMLRKLLREENPELIGVAFDISGKTFRSERFAEYKANRTPMPEDLKSQLPWVRRAIEAYRIPILELANYEADDVLGTLAVRAAAEGYEVVIVSADKDLMQLVRPGISMFHTGRNKLYDPAAVEEDFGLPPERVADVLALMGDAVDNVPGVPGIGEKGAKQLIREFGSLTALLERVGEVPKKAHREGLQQHREQALLSLELVTIPTDLPVIFDPQALRHDPPDQEALRSLFGELEFFSLLEELAPAVARADAPAVTPARELLTAEEWRSAVNDVGRGVYVARIGERPALGLGIIREGEALFADLRREELRAAVLESLRSWSARADLKIVGHDLKEILRIAAPLDPARARLFDTMLVSYVLRPALRGHGVAEVALERFSAQLISETEAGWSKGQEPPQSSAGLLAYAAERVEMPRRFAEAMRPELGDGPLAKVYWEIEAPLVPVLLGMEEAGVRLDVEFLRAMSAELGGLIGGLEGEIYTLAGENFNINSPSQLGTILFEKQSLPVLGRTKKTKGYSTDAETLTELAARGYPLPERILRFRELTKLKSTYVDALPALVAADGRLHTTYEQAVAATGRLSSVNPNLQNIPIRTELGQRIRKAFVAAEGMVLLAADYSQIELRVLAHIAEEPALVDAFQRGEDIHASTAAMVFGGSPELVTPDQRRAAKVINFGIVYGMSAFGLGKTLGIPSSEADRFIKAYLERLPNVKRYMEDTLAQAQHSGKVETLYGRVRYLPDIQSKNFNLRENARRMAINARIQGTAADLLKKAMIAVDRRLRAELPDARLLLTVHDELVLEAPTAAAEAVAELVRCEMVGVESLRVPLLVDVGWGANWHAAKA
ncbi:MAG: DNA polymerase I [Acidobacteriota bacterium]